MKYTITIPPNYTKPVLPGKAEWVEALRSGKYEQGRSFLCNDNKYCCLGVLSKVQDRLINNADGGCNSGIAATNPLYKYLSALGYLPIGVQLVTEELPSIRECSLAGFNDVGFSFNEIADIIDAVWD